MNNPQNSLFLIDHYRDAITNEIYLHSDCLCHPEGVVGKGASFGEAEASFNQDLDRHEFLTHNVTSTIQG